MIYCRTGSLSLPLSACELSPGVRPLTKKSRWIITNIANTANIEFRREATNWKSQGEILQGLRETNIFGFKSSKVTWIQDSSSSLWRENETRETRRLLRNLKKKNSIEIRGFMNSVSMKTSSLCSCLVLLDHCVSPIVSKDLDFNFFVSVDAASYWPFHRLQKLIYFNFH